MFDILHASYFATSGTMVVMGRLLMVFTVVPLIYQIADATGLRGRLASRFRGNSVH
jgi:hypothetical protein